MKIKPCSLGRSIARSKKKKRIKTLLISVMKKEHIPINSTAIKIIIKYSEPIYDKEIH